MLQACLGEALLYRGSATKCTVLILAVNGNLELNWKAPKCPTKVSATTRQNAPNFFITVKREADPCDAKVEDATPSD